MYRTTGPYNRRDYLKPNYAPDDACVMCNKRPANLCRQCRSVWYCSKHCQQEDRPSHEILCEAFTNQKPRPSPAHKRAICFPPNEEKPQLIWVLCRDYGYGESWDVEDYVGATGGLKAEKWLDPHLLPRYFRDRWLCY
ncbi:uncharacterized protein DFL_001973 [Arthrobotrys flagrans]|uniref:MYND-type domain-containing protein n=1 Tax=Arthrobotrys flagrans TaxID=97331 RepID=A0A437A9E1_ARTFL|nr:hypothetical protein DFL_001973 [Arthrobotrys flagrans]